MAATCSNDPVVPTRLTHLSLSAGTSSQRSWKYCELPAFCAAFRNFAFLFLVMIVRLFIKVILLSALSTLFHSQSDFGVNARVVSNSGSLNSRSLKPIVDTSFLIGEEPSKRIGTSGSYENILRIRGGQVIKGKKVRHYLCCWNTSSNSRFTQLVL